MLKSFIFYTKPVCLVIGTMIGGGMLALPFLTVDAGFFPSLLTFAISWATMAYTGILLVDLCVHSPNDADGMLSLAEHYLGIFGKWAVRLLFFLLFYLLISVYIDALQAFVEVFLGLSSIYVRMLLVFSLATLFFLCPVSFVTQVNFLFVILLFSSLSFFLYEGIPHINTSLLPESHFSLMPYVFPIAFVSFAFQGTVPPLVKTLRNNQSQAAISVLVGSLLTFSVYMLWEVLTFSLIDAETLVSARTAETTVVLALTKHLSSPLLEVFGSAFSLFAVLSSLVGVALGLIHFFEEKTSTNSLKRRFFSIQAVFIPPILITLLFPNLFLRALEYAGGVGCALLLGIIPILMTWKALKEKDFPKRFYNKKIILFAFCLIIFYVMGIEVLYTS